MRSRIFLKLLGAALLLIVAATIIIDFSIRHAWEDSLRREIQLSLTQKVTLFANQVQDVRNPQLSKLAAETAQAADARATVIERSGKVLFDSDANPDRMENHATRPEFKAALNGQTGSNSRRSHTLGIEFLYVATPIKDGAVRLAYPLSAIQNTTAEVRRKLVQASALALLISTLLAGLAAHAIAKRLAKITRFAEQVAEGDLSARIADSSSDEIAQVAGALNKTAHRLQDNFTAMENSRKHLETLLNSMQEAVIAVSAEQRIRWVNGSMARLLPQGIQIGKPVLNVVRDPELLKALTDSMQRGTVLSARVSTLVPGQIFEATTAPLPDGGAVAVLHDLTEVERVEKTRRDFIANVSHELRTPLTSIQGYTETLLDSGSQVNGNSREFLEIIRKNVVRMSRLTEDLLTLARVESGERKLDPQPVPADALVQDAIVNFRELARSHEMELALEETTSVQVLADVDAIHQVFSNLINNAINYAKGDDKRILLGAKTSGGSVEFYVRDFGPGIATEHQSRIFERFYRVDKARSRETGGTGLGLAIVKHIVLNHGGTVRVESALNHGATFFFSLPVAVPVPVSS
jgi:two-component system, OmpR family, phosphate regulon sensor histidine kinase PhoR